nr:MAG TPA: hypothetical protein [Caudoviricetes sp.]
MFICNYFIINSSCCLIRKIYSYTLYIYNLWVVRFTFLILCKFYLSPFALPPL